jgi:Uma2 family endonuclease
VFGVTREEFTETPRKREDRPPRERKIVSGRGFGSNRRRERDIARAGSRRGIAMPLRLAFLNLTINRRRQLMSTGYLTTKRATLDDLLKVPGKAELINGRIVHFMATGYRPNIVAGRIFRRLAEHSETFGGEAFTDNIGFAVPELPSGRESFAPDAAYYTGPLPANRMRFIEGAPDLAVEVRSEGDYGRAAEAEMATKRADYFTAGTRVVWDVDPVAGEVHVYRAASPEKPTIYRKGQEAEAEPAVPGWKVSVDWVMK